MPIIACKLGFTQQVVGGATYSFNFDEEIGAYVSEVHDLAHAACFLSITHYEEVKPIEADAEPDMVAESEAFLEPPQPRRGRRKKQDSPVEPEMVSEPFPDVEIGLEAGDGLPETNI